MTAVRHPVALVCTFTWMGFVCAISFLEAWLKFRAPGVTLPIGLGIGRLVFGALNKVELVLATAIVIDILFSRDPRKRQTLVAVPVLVLLVQTSYVLPALDARAERVIAGPDPGPSDLHFIYVALEVVKVAALAVFGIRSFERAHERDTREQPRADDIGPAPPTGPCIMTITPDRTIGSIVAEDFRTAAVFTAHGIDFCCKGGRTIEEACADKGIDPAVLEHGIAEALHGPAPADDPDSWTLTHLAEHIEHVHHGYVAQRTPVLQEYLAKLCEVHGDRHAELFTIAREFDACAGSMAMHMKKEELVLFPFVKRMELAKREGGPLPVPRFGTVENPVRMMMHEHDEEGERFRLIAQLTEGYTPPPDGCSTYRATFALLREFEQDLHRHIHLENNILFPKAVELERSLSHASA